MAHRVLELTLVSGHSLMDVNVFNRMEVYTITSVLGDPRTRQRTRTDRDGARHPTWDDTFLFAVPRTAAKASAAGAYLHLLLRTERLFGFDDRDVGEVFIPLADLLACACVGAGPAPRCATYPVRKVHCSEHRGMLTVAYRFGPVVASLPHLHKGLCWDDAVAEVVGYELPSSGQRVMKPQSSRHITKLTRTACICMTPCLFEKSGLFFSPNLKVSSSYPFVSRD
uniref:C2 domain-containing protein n=1 Tax=Hordeum vulgare subsp. vulgare TaxID=112509 RepID=A0A8I6WGY4_HORVV